VIVRVGLDLLRGGGGDHAEFVAAVLAAIGERSE
jgi:hypothetical protein